MLYLIANIGLIQLVVTLAIVGLIVWLIITYVPMPASFRTGILIVAGICVLFYLLTAFGLLPISHDIEVPRLR